MKIVFPLFEVNINARTMPNGEKRVYLHGPKRTCAVLTLAPKNIAPGWQNAHSHEVIQEMYFVISGKVNFVHLDKDGEYIENTYSAGDHFLASIGIPHNVYMHKGAIIFTVKFGKDLPEHDWKASEELDKLSRDSDIQ
jgi:hypothetical protein